MIRIGIIGSDNSHAIGFSELANKPQPPEMHIPDIKVVGIWGLDAARNQEVAEAGNIEWIADKPQDMIGKIDAAMVVFRHGDLHAPHALPFIEAGIPTFVDKPFALKPADCKKMIAAAQKSGAPITSYSTLRYATQTAAFLKELGGIGKLTAGSSVGPATIQNEYGGIGFYGIHAIELMLAAFGTQVASVRCAECEGNVLATVIYRDGRIVALQFLGNAAYVFQIVAYGKDGYRSHVVDASTCYFEGLKVFVNMVRTGQKPLSYDEMLMSIKVLAAVEESLTAGIKVNIA